MMIMNDMDCEDDTLKFIVASLGFHRLSLQQCDLVRMAVSMVRKMLTSMVTFIISARKKAMAMMMRIPGF